MFILEKPYVSEYLIDTIVQNDFDVLDNDAVEDANIEEGALELVSTEDAVNYYLKQEYPLIYSNSENAISWILENLPNSNLAEYIKLFKDKAEFRELLKQIYPDFYFQIVNYNDLDNIKPDEIKFPVVIKPAMGFLSIGVHTINDKTEWKDTLKTLYEEMKQVKNLYTENVVNSSKFVIEELIQGDEYAIDAYYDRNGEPVILNIFEHPRLDNKDVKDRIYITSTSIMIKYMAKFGMLLRQVGELKEIKNFPLHMEVRVTEDGKIIPIEINPMRFAGWCTTDLAHYAWGINVYKCFSEQIRPNWNEILMNSDNKIYYFSLAEVPNNITRGAVDNFNYREFLTNFSEILELRRINPRQNPLFAIVFGRTDNIKEIREILQLNMANFVE